MKSVEPHNLEIICTKDINLFLPLMKEIVELEERFLVTILRWCEYGRPRRMPLKYWRVFIAITSGEPVGVTGLYQNKNTPAHIGWLGWFGVRPRFRCLGIGSKMMRYTEQYAANLCMTELWVYTDDNDSVAIEFYKKQGFAVLGRAIDLFPDNGYEVKNIVLKKFISI